MTTHPNGSRRILVTTRTFLQWLVASPLPLLIVSIGLNAVLATRVITLTTAIMKARAKGGFKPARSCRRSRPRD